MWWTGTFHMINVQNLQKWTISLQLAVLFVVLQILKGVNSFIHIYIFNIWIWYDIGINHGPEKVFKWSYTHTRIPEQAHLSVFGLLTKNWSTYSNRSGQALQCRCEAINTTWYYNSNEVLHTTSGNIMALHALCVSDPYDDVALSYIQHQPLNTFVYTVQYQLSDTLFISSQAPILPPIPQNHGIMSRNQMLCTVVDM